jgi:pimeloyl-ACP methyl ester carboxylesterase
MKLHYRRIGAGKPVFIFHGLFGMNDNWQQFALKLADQGHEVILADLRNHGHSPHAEIHDYLHMSEDIQELLVETGVHNPVLIGHSMGGKAVLKWAAEHPECDARIISIDIAPWAYGFRHTAILQALEAVDPPTLMNRKEAEERMRKYISETSIINFLLKNLHRTSDDTFQWRFNLPVISREISEVGQAVWPEKPIEKLILFVKGSNSDYIETGRWPEIELHYPNAKLVTIEGAGHWIHVDRPMELLDVVNSFLK